MKVGEPGVLQSMRPQRLGHDLVIEQQHTYITQNTHSISYSKVSHGRTKAVQHHQHPDAI